MFALNQAEQERGANAARGGENLVVRGEGAQHSGLHIDRKNTPLTSRFPDGSFIHLQDGNSHLLGCFSLQSS